MKNRTLVFLLACAAASGQSATVEPLSKSIADYIATPVIEPASAITTAAIRPKLGVFTGDDVVSQFVNGAGWKTTIVFANLETYTVSFDLLFIGDAGTDLTVPIAGVGSVHGLKITLPAQNTIQVETTGAGAALQQGWALMDREIVDTIGGLAIFKQVVAGKQDQEAVVPFASQFKKRTLLLFDNVGTVTGVAIANPFAATNVVVTIRDDNGVFLSSRPIQLAKSGHTAVVTSDSWPETKGKRGTMEFTVTTQGVAVLGLRFNGAAFTSFHPLENLDWSN